MVSCFVYSSAIKIEVTSYSETSVHFQRNTWSYNQKYRTLHNHRCENLKSYITLKPVVMYVCKTWSMTEEEKCKVKYVGEKRSEEDTWTHSWEWVLKNQNWLKTEGILYEPWTLKTENCSGWSMWLRCAKQIQTGRSRVPFPMRSLDFFNCPNPSSRTTALSANSDSNRNEYQESSWW
jgi:hypothetical protein